MADKDFVLLSELNKKTYADQAKWFLNTTWNERFATDEAAREQIWTFTHNMIKLDKINGARGSGLPELTAHIFLEKNSETQTWTEFRDKMRDIGFEHKNVSLLNFLIFNFKLDHHVLVNSTSGLDEDAEAKIAEAQEKLDQAQAALEACIVAKAEADQAASEAADALAAQEAAEAEVKAGLEAIQAEEAKKAARLAKLKAMSENEKFGQVKRGRAFQEFKQLEGEDPLPLRKAKIEQKAKVRKMKRLTKACAKAQKRADKAAENAAAAVKEARDALEAAEQFVSEVKASCKGGTNDGILWWMDRELVEARKYLPKGKAAALERRVKRQQKALKKKKKAAKLSSTGGASTGKLMLEIGGAGKKPLKKTETRGEGVSDAVKAAFVADANNEPTEDPEEEEVPAAE